MFVLSCPSVTDRTAGTSKEDERIERAALLYVLAVHPTCITVRELARALDSRGVADHQPSIESAVARLIDFGLLHRNGDFLFPTLTAVRLDQLLGAS